MKMSRRRWPFKRLRFYLAVSIITLSSFLFLACGSGGGGGGGGEEESPPAPATPAPVTPAPVTPTSSVSGVAATGAAIVGEVFLKDSSVPSVELSDTLILADNGVFSFDVTGLTTPFYIKVVQDGTGDEY